MKLRKANVGGLMNLSIPEAEEKKKIPVFKLIFLCVVIIGLVIGGLYWHWSSKWIITHGRITLEQTRIATPIKGKIASIAVKERDNVKKGQLLISLDNSEYLEESKLAEAKIEEFNKQVENLLRAGLDFTYQINVQLAERDLEQLKDKKLIAEADLKSAKLTEDYTKKTAERKDSLFKQKAITQLELDDANAEWHKAKSLTSIAQARVDEAVTSVKWAEKLLDSRTKMLNLAKQRHEDDIALLKIQMESAKTELKRANAKLEQTRIYSPTNGYIAWLAKNVGEVVDHNNIIMVIYKNDSIWVEAYLSGAELSQVHDGKEATFEVFSIKDKTFTGIIRLSYPLEKSNPEFIVGPKDAAFPSQIYRIVHPVKITFSEPPPANLQPEELVKVLIERK